MSDEINITLLSCKGANSDTSRLVVVASLKEITLNSKETLIARDDQE